MDLAGWQSREVPRAVLESVLARAPMGVAVVDRQGRYLWVNPAFAALAGVDADQLIGSWYLDPVLREDWDANVAAGRRALAGEVDGYELDERLIRPDGELRWVHAQVRLERSDDGEPVHFVAVVTDVTAERQATEAARMAEERFDLASEAAPIAVAQVDLHGRYVRVNPAMCELFGRRPDELVGMSLVDLTVPEDRAKAGAAVARLARGEAASHRADKRYLHASGRPFWVTTHAVTVTGPDGRPDHLLAYYVDIDARVRERHELAAAEERARRLGDLSPDGVTVADLDGHILYANEAFAELLGMPAEELLGQVGRGAVPTATGPPAARWAAVRAGETVRGSVERVKVRGGGQVHVEVSSTPIDFDGRPAVLSVTRDVTERVRQEAAVAELQERHRQSFEHAPIAKALVALDGTWLTVNPALCRLLDVDAARLQQLTFQEITHPDDLDADLTLLAQTMVGEIPGYSIEKRYLRPDGSVVFANLHVAAVCDEDGEPLYFVAQIEDLTERRQREDQVRRLADELQASNQALQAVFNEAAAGQARYRALVDHLPETGAYLYGRDHRIRIATGSSPYHRELGEPELLGRTPDDLLLPEDAARINAFIDDAFAGRPTTAEIASQSSGRDHLVDVVAIATGEGERADEVLLVARDITDRKDQERQLIRAEARFAALVEHSSDFTAITGADGVLRYLSPAWERITDIPVEGALGRDLWSFVHPDDLGRAADLLRELLEAPDRSTSLTCRIRHGGDWRHVEMVVTNRLADPAVGGIVTNARDVTDRVLAANRLAHQAMHDPLTDLPNRALLVDRLEHLLAHRRHPSRCAVLFIDLDRFKTVNDSLGHRAGDDLLVTVADRLRSVVRPADTVARLGGDEFIVLAEDIVSADLAFEIADRVRAAVTAPITLGDHTVSVGCSIGIALSGRHHPDQLLQEADMALYRAKERGRNRSELFDQGLQVLARQRHDTEQIVRAALEDGRVEVHHQPIVDLGTGAAIATEALARIRLPDGTLLHPDDFIPVAEETGLIIPLGIAVLDAACAQQAAWSAAGDGPRQLAVNVSASQLLSSTFVDDVRATLDRHRLAADALCFEITESTLIDAGPSARRQIDRLKGLGVTLALDDFGTGWCSLSYLRRFPLDVLKIDRSFVDGLGADDGDTEVVRAVIGLGHALRLTTVAEGVETERQHAMLHALGCDQAQGFRYSKPVPPRRLAPPLPAAAS